AEATRLAAELDDVNRERQRIQEVVWTEALAAAEPWADAPAIVVGGQGWHHGVVGIIAARLVDRFAKPSIVVAFDGESWRGWARLALATPSRCWPSRAWWPPRRASSARGTCSSRCPKDGREPTRSASTWPTATLARGPPSICWPAPTSTPTAATAVPA